MDFNIGKISVSDNSGLDGDNYHERQYNFQNQFDPQMNAQVDQGRMINTGVSEQQINGQRDNEIQNEYMIGQNQNRANVELPNTSSHI